MDKLCEICQKTAKYKCPKCYIHYCSVPCCKLHKNDNCEDKSSRNNHQEDQKSKEKRKEIGSGSIVPKEKLELLDTDEVKNLLANKHLRDLLMVIDKAENAEKIMEEAMQEPIFVEFADACLKVVDPNSDDEN